MKPTTIENLLCGHWISCPTFTQFRDEVRSISLDEETDIISIGMPWPDPFVAKEVCSNRRFYRRYSVSFRSLSVSSFIENAGQNFPVPHSSWGKCFQREVL